MLCKFSSRHILPPKGGSHPTILFTHRRTA
jgi:hypothetical protein